MDPTMPDENPQPERRDEADDDSTARQQRQWMDEMGDSSHAASVAISEFFENMKEWMRLSSKMKTLTPCLKELLSDNAKIWDTTQSETLSCFSEYEDLLQSYHSECTESTTVAQSVPEGDEITMDVAPIPSTLSALQTQNERMKKAVYSIDKTIQRENPPSKPDIVDSARELMHKLLWDNNHAAGDAISKFNRIGLQLNRSFFSDTTTKALKPDVDKLGQQVKVWEDTQYNMTCALGFSSPFMNLQFNCPLETEICTLTQRIPDGYGSAMGTALFNNSVVTSIALNLSLFLGKQKDPNHSQAIPMQHFLSSCPSLRKLELNVPSENRSSSEVATFLSLEEKFLFAASENASIDDLTCSGSIFSCIGIHRFLSKRQLLKSLCIWLDDDSRNDNNSVHSASDKALFLSAFHSTLTIENLTMQPSSQWDFAAAVLLQATTSGSSKVTLELSDREDIRSLESIDILESYLQITSTLQHLKLSNHQLMEEESAQLFYALTNHFYNPTASLRKLSLGGCKFLDDAADSLLEFMQTPIGAAQFTGDKKCSFLQELCMRETKCAIVEDDSSTSYGRILAGMFRHLPLPGKAACPEYTLPNGLMATHGSQLLNLSMHTSLLPSFFDEVAASSSTSIVRLPILMLSGNDYFCTLTEEEHEKSYRELDCSLSEVTCLSELNLERVHCPRCLRRFGKSLRGNSSARVISLPLPYKRGDPWISGDPLRIKTRKVLQAYCSRNASLLKLLLNMTGSSEKQDMNYVPFPKRLRRMNGSVREACTEPFLFPSLLEVAKHMPKTKRATIFWSLMLSELSIGPSKYSM